MPKANEIFPSRATSPHTFDRMTSRSDQPNGSGDPSRYDDLRELARRALARERVDHTFQTADLVHEAWMRIGQDGASRLDRSSFYAAAARAMRQALIDHARARRALRRDAARRVPMEGEHAEDLVTRTDAIDLDAALERLAVAHRDCAEVIELRYFAGLSAEEIADVREVSKRTIERALKFATSWLARELRGER